MKKNKLPKFLVCKNPMAEPDGLYILHTRPPQFIAKAIKTDSLTLLELQKSTFCTINEVQYNIGVQTRVNGQLWALFVLEFYCNEVEINPNEIGSGGLMSRLGDWFHAYIKYVEK
jgi:hypothetical protein